MKLLKAIIEMPEGTRYKYEQGPNGNMLLDRVLSVPIPHNYGFIPNTLAPDGDALDVFIVGLKGHPLTQGTELEFTPIAILTCEDNGQSDDKVIGVLPGVELTRSYLVDIYNYLATYKPGFKVLDYKDKPEDIAKIVEATEAAYSKPFITDVGIDLNSPLAWVSMQEVIGQDGDLFYGSPVCDNESCEHCEHKTKLVEMED